MKKLLLKQWKPVVGFEEHYEISNYGDIRSLRHRYGLRKIPLIMSPSKNSKGYLQINLLGEHCKKIHRMVLEAFVGSCPKEFQGSHIDGNNQNNFVGNLIWESPMDNSKRKFEHGTVLQGERNPPAKLSRFDVTLIRLRHALNPKITGRALAKQFNVSHPTIFGILSGRYWKCV